MWSGHCGYDMSSLHLEKREMRGLHITTIIIQYLHIVTFLYADTGGEMCIYLIIPF